MPTSLKKVVPFDPFEVENISSWILDHSFSAIALQFPSELYSFSVRISDEIRSTLLTNQNEKQDIRLFILADSKYANSSPDYTAAAHVEAEALIHFGPASFTLHHMIPTLYIFPESNLFVHSKLFESSNSDSILHHLLESLSSLSFYHIKFIYDSTCLRIVPIIKNQLEQKLLPASISWISDEIDTFFETDAYFPTSISKTDHIHNKNETTNLHLSSKPVDNTQEILTIYMTCGDLLQCPGFANQFLTHSDSLVYGYSFKEQQLTLAHKMHKRLISQRYRMISMIEKASVIGILVGNLALDNLVQKISISRALISRAGKSSVVMAIGKLNEPKLINLPEIDIYVYLAPPNESLFDPREFKRDIATPFELACATIPSVEWDTYSLDSTAVFQIISDFLALDGTDLDSTSTKTNTDINNHGEDSIIPHIHMTTDIVEQNNIIQAFNKTRASWKGLDPTLESPVEKYSLGFDGIAAEYTQITE